MRFPKALPDGGTIGFVAPSFGCATEPYKTSFDNALYKWKKQGYGISLGPNCYLSDGIGISTNPNACAVELMDSYCDQKSDVIISCGGGELMCETISKVDFDRIRAAEPKWYMGYSDNTNFTFLLNTLCDTASIYGQCAASFGTEESHTSLKDAMSVLTSDAESISLSGYDRWEYESLRDEEHPLAGYNLDRESYVRAYMGNNDAFDDSTKEEESVSMEGRLIGGCLDCLVNLCGTRFDRVKEFNKKYGDEGIIWFVEACDLNVMSIRRSMWELEEAGWFEKASGFIIGRPMHFDEDMMGLNQYKAVYDVVSHYRVPIIMDADIGHLPPMLPIISGSYAYAKAGGGKWSIRMDKR